MLGLGVTMRSMRRFFSSSSPWKGSQRGTVLVNGDWLEPRLDQVKIFDATWFLPTIPDRNADSEFHDCRIPNSLRFDLDALSDHQTTGLPHMLPDFNWFGERMDEIGISPRDTIVCYDGLGQFSAARAFWTLWVLGAQDVKLLDGGLPKWLAEKRRTANGEPVVEVSPNPPGTWTSLASPRIREEVLSVHDIQDFVDRMPPDVQLVDARPANRYLGIDPEPRPNLKQGKIPGSLNLPFNKLLNPDATFKSDAELKQAFQEAGVDLSKSKIMTTCGSGTTAAIVSVALRHLLGAQHAPLYDGSFAEWGQNRPVE